jgi:hypothetical protein
MIEKLLLFSNGRWLEAGGCSASFSLAISTPCGLFISQVIR